MLFEWDDDKRRLNLRKHGIDFLDANAIWAGDVLEYTSRRDRHGEQ